MHLPTPQQGKFRGGARCQALGWVPVWVCAGLLGACGGSSGGGDPGAGTPANPGNPGNGGSSEPWVLKYLEKTTSGALDYMGVKVTRTDPSQKLWAPGSAAQEYPGGWVTPGQYRLTINSSRVHHHISGVLTGRVRSGHQLMGVVVRRALSDPGWTNHGFYDPPNMRPQEWGDSTTVSLQAGDTLHVAYGNKIVDWQKRNGSDGMVVHCVAKEPAPRGGLWGTGTEDWSAEKWAFFKRRVREAAGYYSPRTDYFNYGPAAIPDPIPSDYANDASDRYDNRQAEVISRWLLNRSMEYIRDGSAWKGNKDHLQRLFEFFCNNTQLCFLWSDTSGEHYHYAHGPNRYPPYQVNAFLDAITAAVALDYDLSFEPLYRIVSHLAQRPDMTLSHAGSYTYGNHPHDGGLSKHRDDDQYTRWLWYTLGVRDMKFRGSHRHKVWGPCVWARDLMGWPMTKATEQCLAHSGNKVVPHGHEWTQQGAGAGFAIFYAQLEVEGAMFLWFTGTHTNSQFNRWARRNYLYTRGANVHYYAQWCQATFVKEPEGLSGGVQGTGIILSWVGNSDPPLPVSYQVYRGTSPDELLLHAENIEAPEYLDLAVSSGQTYYYAITAVDESGHESSLSDMVSVSL